MRLRGAHAGQLLSSAALASLSDVHEYGQRLAELITELTTGPSEEQAVLQWNDPKWRAAYLRYWQRIERVWLAGGNAAGLGLPLAEAVSAKVAREVRLAPNPVHAALFGAARSYAMPRGPRLVLDFGQSAVKRGLASYRDGRLERVDLLPSTAAPTEQVVEFVRDTLRDSMREAGDGIDRHVVASLACYVVAGRPVDKPSTYSPLKDVSNAEIARGLGIRLSYLHDGTAAARGIDDPEHSAVITLGTYMAVGFTETRGVRLLPLAPSLATVPPAN